MTRWYWQLFNHLINSIKLNAVKRQQGPSLSFLPPLVLHSSSLPPSVQHNRTLSFHQSIKRLTKILKRWHWTKDFRFQSPVERIRCPFNRKLVKYLSPLPLCCVFFPFLYYLPADWKKGLLAPSVYCELTVCINLSGAGRKCWNKLTKKANRLPFQ